MADFFKWSSVCMLSLVLVVLSALSYVHMAFPILISIVLLSWVYVKSLINEHNFLEYDVS